MSFTLINVLGLAMGLCCAILVMTHVAKEYSYDTCIPEHERVFHLVKKTPGFAKGGTYLSYGVTPLLAEKFSEIQYFSRTENYSNSANCIVSYKNERGDITSFDEDAFYVADSSLFSILKYPFAEGRRETALNQPNSIVLSKETAIKYFGTEPALGKTLLLNNERSFTVSGVVDIPDYVTFEFSVVAPITTIYSEQLLATVEGNQNGEPYIKLHENVDVAGFSAKIKHFYGDILPDREDADQIVLSTLPIAERRLHYGNGPYILVIISLIVLLVSVLNYINMSTSLMHERTSEIAVKKITGASGLLIGRQLILETAVVCFGAILLGVVLAISGTPLFNRLTGSDLQPFLQSNIPFFVIGCVALWIVITVFAGFYPALILSRSSTISLLQNKKSTVSMRSKGALVTFQFVISIILIVATLTTSRQYRFMTEMPLGFNNEWVIQLPFSDELKGNSDLLLEELRKIPAVRNASAASALPVGISHNFGIKWTDEKGEQRDESMSFVITTDGYTETFGMDVLQGRPFLRNRLNEKQAVLINESAAKMLGFKNPVGEYLNFWGQECAIIGVVKDFQNNFLYNKIAPMVFYANPDNQGFTKFLYVSIHPEKYDHTIAKIEKVIKNISPSFPFEYRFTDEEVEAYLEQVARLTNAFQFTSIIALLLAVVGITALTYHSTRARTKEVGVRKVNGARTFEVLMLLNWDFFKWVVIAFLIACPIAWYLLTQLLETFAYKTGLSWWIFALAGALALGIALLTVSFQSYKAAVRNPVESLRYE